MILRLEETRRATATPTFNEPVDIVEFTGVAETESFNRFASVDMRAAGGIVQPSAYAVDVVRNCLVILRQTNPFQEPHPCGSSCWPCPGIVGRAGNWPSIWLLSPLRYSKNSKISLSQRESYPRFVQDERLRTPYPTPFFSPHPAQPLNRLPNQFLFFALPPKPVATDANTALAHCK